MPTKPSPSVTAGLAGCTASTLATLVLTGPSFRPGGVLLYRDFVSVPNPALNPRALGTDGRPPRAVPLDAATAFLDPVIPTWLQQQSMLAATLLLAGCGVALLLRAHGVTAAVVGAGVAVWSPYAAERLLVGQPPTLLAWSVLPWIALAVRRSTTSPCWLAGVTLAALPAALTPFGGVVALVSALTMTWWQGGRWRRLLAVLGAGLVWCSPWLARTLTAPPIEAEPDGAQAFSPLWRGPTGVLDVLGGGGIWATGAVPDSRSQALPLICTALILAFAAVGALAAGPARRDRAALAALALAPPVVTLVLSRGPGLDVFARAQSLPAVALFRDTHRLLGLSTLALALLAGLAVPALTRSLPSAARRPATAAVALVATLITVGQIPDFATRMHTAYRPVSMPVGWAQAVETVNTAPPGKVLILPWSALRRQNWVGTAPFLDPVPLAVSAESVSASTLAVQREGVTLNVGAREVDPEMSGLGASTVLDPAALRRAGVSVVVEWIDTPGVVPSLEHLTLAHESSALRVWTVPAS